MPKGKYGAWNEDDMSRALQAFRNGDMGLNECCRQYAVPKPTLLRHLKGTNVKANEETKSFGRSSVLPPAVEKELVEHILKLETLMFGLTINDVRRLAFQIVERNKIPHTFNKETQMAGKKWFYAFKARHKDILSLREPQATSMMRAKGFNRKNVYGFFDLLEKVVDENKIDATRIFNVDETGVSTVQNKCQKVLAQKGKRQVGAVSSGERGVNTTMVACASASGIYIPPMLIFKRMRMNNDLRIGAPPGSVVEISESGYMTSDLFVKWLQHFIDCVKPTEKNTVLLVLDGHTTHSKNLDALLLARKHGVIILQLPGHTTHRVQPLDRSFFGPFKSYYTQSVEKWLRSNPGYCVTQLHVAGLITEAYGRAASIENAVSGFRATGVWPVDRLVFKDDDFCAANNLGLNEPEAYESYNADASVKAPTATSTEEEPVTGTTETYEGNQLIWPELPSIQESLPKTSRAITPTQKKPQSISDSQLNISIEAISPIPKPHQNIKKQTAQKAVVLTESPYKNELEIVKQLQAAQELVKELKTKLGKNKRTVTKKLVYVPKFKSEGKKSKEPVKKNSTKKERKCPSKPILLNAASSSTQSDVVIEMCIDDWHCSICEEKRIEDMIQCTKCHLWSHELCAGVQSGKQTFICVECK